MEAIEQLLDQPCKHCGGRLDMSEHMPVAIIRHEKGFTIRTFWECKKCGEKFVRTTSLIGRLEE